MLYVFHVDAGTMVTFDMNLTLQSVSCLKQAIEKRVKIPANMLVLLVSGGDVLQSDNLVSSYGAGTDSSPIFLFIKPSMKDNSKQSSQYSVNSLSPILELSAGAEWYSNIGISGEIKSLTELKTAVDMCCSLPPLVSTVVTCAKLAQQFSECAHSVARSCEQLVHDQHLQHQGWAAVVANLEDIFSEFCDRSKNFKEIFKKHKLKRDYYNERMLILNNVLESLGKIPMLPSLKLNAEAHRFSAFDVFEEAILERQCVESSERQSCSSDNKAYQDFGVDAFKLSEEEVFEEGKQKSDKGQNIEEASQRMQESDEGVTFKGQSSESKDSTLLHWILAQGNKDALQDILDYCNKGILLIDEDPLKEREAKLCNILEIANVLGLKQIKGIEDRLYGLDQLRNDVLKLEKDQHDQAAALIQNRDRVSATCDSSVLPTLVQSHRCQLEKLLKNHERLIDIKRRIAKSKEELSHILKARLETVLMIENSMSIQDAHQMLSFQCLSRLSRYFEVVEQLHLAPIMFIRAVHEVARRRTFSDAYLQWAASIASHLLKIHSEEVTRRQEFNTLFEGHFLKSLFPGMGDLPPSFATEAPIVFDSRLPKVTGSDAEYVSSIFPDLSKDIPKYNMEDVVQYFKQYVSIIEKEVETRNLAESGKDIEPETETEFEELRESTTEKQKIDMSTICVPDTLAVSTITEVRSNNTPLSIILESPLQPRKFEEFENSDFYIEESLPSSLEWGRDERQDNMDTHKINMEKLREFLISLYELCKLNIMCIKEEMLKLKDQMDEQRKYVARECVDISEACEKRNQQMAISFREETQRMTVDHELELSDIKNVISNKDEEIGILKSHLEEMKLEQQKIRDGLESEHEKTKVLLKEAEVDVKNVEMKLEEAELNKQKEIKELQDRMHMDYKSEIESMRSRFRLVALTNNMDRSPSESSLEKIERTDVIEISNHNAIVMQTKENAEVEKEEAIKEAVEKCEKEWQLKMEEEIKSLVAKYENDKQVTLRDATRRLIAEKDRQIESLREREKNLTRECTKYKETIQQLADPETNDYECLLKTQMATLENEKSLMAQEIQDLKKELEQKSEQIDKAKEGDSEATISSSSKNESSKRNKSRSHTPLGLPAGTISLSSCLPGHTVLIMWDPAHHNYTILQESSIMYFVHTDCLPALDLSINVKSESERRLYAVGIIESKEFCYAKKEGNRYHMPRTSRFYRVRVRPARAHQAAPPCCDARHHKPHDCLKPVPLSVFTDRPVKKWLTYLHAPDIQKSSEAIQPAAAAAAAAAAEGAAEVATATLINLESPAAERRPAADDQPDSIETSSEWHTARMQQSSMSSLTDMECSVGRVLELPAEAPAPAPLDPELAEEATP